MAAPEAVAVSDEAILLRTPGISENSAFGQVAWKAQQRQELRRTLSRLMRRLHFTAPPFPRVCS